MTKKKLLILSGASFDGVARLRLLNLAHNANLQNTDTFIKTRDLNFVKYNLKEINYDYYINKSKLKSRSKLSVFLGKLFRKISNIAFFIDYTFFYWIKENRKIIEFIKTQNIDYVFISGPPHSVFYLVPEIYKKTNAKVILDLRDPFSLHPYVKTSFIDNYLEKKCFELAYKIILTSPSTLKEYKKKYSNYIKKMDLITNGIDPEILRTFFVSKTNSDKINIVFAGKIYDYNILEKFVSAINDCKCVNAFKILLIGTNYYDFDKMFSKYNVNYEILPQIPYAEVMKIYQNSLAFLIFMRESEYSKTYPLLVKAYEALFFDKPIIYIGPKTDTYDLVKKYSSEYFCLTQDHDFSQLSKYLDDLAVRLKTNDKYYFSSKINENFVSEYNRNILSKKILKLMN